MFYLSGQLSSPYNLRLPFVILSNVFPGFPSVPISAENRANAGAGRLSLSRRKRGGQGREVVENSRWGNAPAERGLMGLFGGIIRPGAARMGGFRNVYISKRVYIYTHS